MSPLYESWEARQRLRDREDTAVIGSPLPREQMPIEFLFAELDRSMKETRHRWSWPGI